jgi:lycopene cyclase domain-containing protein
MVKYISTGLIFGVLLLIVSNITKLYTVLNGLFFLILITFSMVYSKNYLTRFYISFLIILVPFYIVNGILTGSFIAEEVVWYNEAAIIGVRWGTIPLEDVIYCFNLLYANLLVVEKIRYKKLFSST